MGFARSLSFTVVSSVACSTPLHRTADEPKLVPVQAAPSRDTPPGRALAAPAWLETARLWPPLLDRPLPSAHLGRRHVADVRVSPEARALYLALTPEVRFPAGAWFVEMLRDAANGREGPVLALVVEAEGPRFMGLDAQGTPLTPAALEPCPACHAGAPAPPLFGLPRLAVESKAALPRSL